MKVQLLLRRVDPLDARADGSAASRAYEPTAAAATSTTSIGTLDTFKQSSAAELVRHRPSPASATTAATSSRGSGCQEESRRHAR